MYKIFMHLANISVKQMIKLYKDLKRISKILTNNPIEIEDLFKIWQRNRDFLEPICSSVFECIQKSVTDEQFRNEVLAKIEFCDKWVWKQIIVKSAKELLDRSIGFWTSLKDIIKQKLIDDNDKDIKIKDELEMMKQKIERLKQIVIETKDLITQLEKCDVEDQIKSRQLFKAIETKIDQALKEEVIETDELKEFIVKYQKKQRNANGVSGILQIASAIGVIATIVCPPSYFLTTAAGGVSTFVFSTHVYSCTADKVKELRQQLTRLEAYKREYEETMKEIHVLNETTTQVSVANLTKLAAKQNSNANKIDVFTCFIISSIFAVLVYLLV